jgi:hypothetical protein
MDVVGRSLVVGSQAVVVVGVMPVSFEVPNAAADLWLPLDANVDAPSRFAHTLRVVGRSKGHADADTVRRDLDILAAQLAEERPAENEGWRVTVLPLFELAGTADQRREGKCGGVASSPRYSGGSPSGWRSCAGASRANGCVP